MQIVILYLGITCIGYFFGSRLRRKEAADGKKRDHRWTGKLQLGVIVLLVFTMGSRIGSDRSIIASLSSIGITAFVFTIFAVSGSIAAVFLVRRLMGFNKEGVREK